MMQFVILLALAAAATAETIPRLNLPSPTDRIVGGVNTDIEQVPHQVSLQILGSHNCGGSIISANWILTAAHCMVYPASWYTIRSGSTLSNGGGTLSSPATIINHENYASNAWGVPVHDVALIQLSTALTWSSTQAPIALFSAGQESDAGSMALTSGWGLLSAGGSLPVILQSVSVPVVSKAECSATYSMWGGLPDGQICVGVPEGGVGACNADSGGPLSINGVLAGVVSWGVPCALPGFPTVYAEVAAYRAWITANSGV